MDLEAFVFIIVLLLIPILIVWDTAKNNSSTGAFFGNKMRSLKDVDPKILDYMDQTYKDATEIEERFASALIEFSSQKNKHKQLQMLRELQLLRLAILEHIIALTRRLDMALKLNEYGAISKDERLREIEIFFDSIRYVPNRLDRKFAVSIVLHEVERAKIERKSIGFNVETMPKGDALLFEHWTAESLEKFGWTARVTKASADNGVDVVAVKEGLSVAVQCKLYKGSVGNKAVQEVYSGMKHMQLDRAVVISTGRYTKAAKNLAATTGVLLLSEHDIAHMWQLLTK